MSAKRISVTSILVAFTLIASFISALLPLTILPQYVQADTTVTVYTTVGTTNWTCPNGVTSVEVLVVGGGGAGGGSTVSLQCGGGGGAGGVRYNASYPVSAGTSYTVTVGSGGTGDSGQGNDGGSSVFDTITAAGGGGGGDRDSAGNNGGSGGGGGLETTAEYNGGSGNTPSTSPSQGNNGARSFYDYTLIPLVYWRSGGGGGGAGAVGTEGTKTQAPDGGAGVSTYSTLLILANVGQDIGGVHWIGGGGGGGTAAASPQSSGGNGGGGGGGDFDTGSCIKDGCDATPNTGGGGGGAYSGGSSQVGGDGGSGVVIIRYASLTISAGSGGTITTPAAGAGTYGYSYNKVVNINASPNSCYTFVNWTGTGVDAGKVANANAASTTITMSDNYSVQANFAINTYALSESGSPSAGGTPSHEGSSPFNCNTLATIHANTNSSCYTFSGWTPTDGVTSPSSEDTTVNMSQARTLTANYAIKTFALSESGSPSAGGTPSHEGSSPFNCNTLATIHANTNSSCYTFSGWTPTDGVTSPSSEDTTVNMSQARTLTANYAIKTFALSVSPNNSGGTPYFDGSSPFNCNTLATIHANTSSGYTFSGWTPTDGVTSPSSEDTTVNMSQARTLTANYTPSNSAPTISAVALYDLANGSVPAMTPRVEYYVKVTVSDANNLNDLDTVKVWIYYDTDTSFDSAEKVSGNTQTGVLLTWTNADPDTWVIDPTGGDCTWELVTDNCSSPTLTETSGDFKFNFKPGKVAKASPSTDCWQIYAEAYDGAATGNNNQQAREMNWYGEVIVNTDTVNWGDVDAGLPFGNGSPSQETVSVTYICNGNYNQSVQASATWIGSPSGSAILNTVGPPGANEFSLKADDDGTLDDAIIVLSGSYQTLDTTGTITSEIGNTETANSLWLSIGTPFTKATYSGTIYYQIAQ